MVEITAAEATKIAEAKLAAEKLAETNLAAALVAAKNEGYNDAAQIVELCQLAGTPRHAVKFIGEKKSAADVRKALIDEKAAEQAKTAIDTALMPGADAADPKAKTEGKAKPWSEIMSALGGKKSAKA